MYQQIASIHGFAVYGTTLILAVLLIALILWLILGNRLTGPLSRLLGCKRADPKQDA